MFGCGENNKTETRVNVTILQEVICRTQVTFLPISAKYGRILQWILFLG